MAKNLVSDLILAPLAQIWVPHFFSRILPLLDARHCCNLSLYATARKTNEPNLRKWQKNLVSDLFLVPLVQILVLKTFFVDFYTTRCLTLLQLVIYAVSRTANDTTHNGKILILSPILAHFGQNLVPKNFFMAISSTRCYTLFHCCKLSLYALSR